MRSQTNHPPRFWPLAAIAVGVLLLLANFKLFDFDVLQLWPLLLVALGVQVLWRGDLGITWQGQSFGITRGSIEEAALEADAGELDLKLRALRREGRLLAGQYTARSRPRLEVMHNRAALKMRRAETWLLSLADWEVGLAQDVTWRLLLSAHLGEINADLRALEIDEARVATGIGDITLVCPDRPAGPVWVRSTFGDITVEVPEATSAQIRLQRTALTKVSADERFIEVEPGLWATTDYEDGDEDALSIEVVAVLGNVRMQNHDGRTAG